MLELPPAVTVTITGVVESLYTANLTGVGFADIAGVANSAGFANTSGFSNNTGGFSNASGVANSTSGQNSSSVTGGLALLGNVTSRSRVVINTSDALNVPLGGGSTRRLLAANASGLCARTVLSEETNITTSEVEMEIDYPPEVFVGIGAINITARLEIMRALRERALGRLRGGGASGNLAQSLTLWENCTGVPAEASFLAVAAEVVLSLASASPRRSDPLATAPPAEMNLAALLVAHLLLLALCCCCCCCPSTVVAWGRHRSPAPLPALRLTLPGGRTLLLPLRWGAVHPQMRGDCHKDSAEEVAAVEALSSSSTRSHHQLVVVIPVGAPCREPLGLRPIILEDSYEYDLVLPVIISAPLEGDAVGMCPVRWYADGRASDGRSLAALHASCWAVDIPRLPREPKVELRVATLAERRLLLDDGHNGPEREGGGSSLQKESPEEGDPAFWGSVQGCALLPAGELARRLRPAKTDAGASTPGDAEC